MVTATGIASLFAQDTDKVWLLLLTISHAEMTTIRVVQNTQDVVSRGNTFVAFPFELELPGETDQDIPRVRLRVDNVSQQIVGPMRTIGSAPAVTLEVVLADAPDTLEAGPFEFALRNAVYNALTIEGELVFQDGVLAEPYPGDAFTPANFPALFR